VKIVGCDLYTRYQQVAMGHSNKDISQRYARTGVKIDGMFRTMTAQR
jgi:hypothetical protein